MAHLSTVIWSLENTSRYIKFDRWSMIKNQIVIKRRVSEAESNGILHESTNSIITHLCTERN